MTKKCLNCETSLISDEKYCKVCGQSMQEGRIDIKSIFQETFAIFFNFDSRFWQTIRDIHKPHALTEAYVQGKRRKYVNPIRLFVVLLFLLGLHFYWNANDIDLFVDNRLKNEVEIQKRRFKEADTLVNIIAKPYMEERVRDSILCAKFPNYYGSESSFPMVLFKIDYKKKYNITNIDAYEMDMDTLLSKYKVTDLLDKMLVILSTKTARDPEESIKSLFANSIWILFLQCFIAAAFLYIFFFNRQYYFSEHLVLNLYGHCLMFFLLLTLLLCKSLFPSDASIVLTVGLGVVFIILQWRSLRSYYRLGVIKTTVLQVLFFYSYLFGLLFSMFLVWLFNTLMS